MKHPIPNQWCRHVASGLLLSITAISFQACNKSETPDATIAAGHHTIDPQLISSEQSVNAISIERDGPHQPFFDHLIQFDNGTSDIILATMDQEFLLAVSKAKEADRNAAETISPRYVWKVESGTDVARFVGPEGWDHTRTSIKVASQSERDAKKTQAVRALAGEGEPSWWPSDEEERDEGVDYGVVIPGQSAMAYLLMGKATPKGADLWGSVHTHTGPYTLVVERFDDERSTIHVANLLGDFEIGGMAMEFSADGSLAIITTTGAQHMWLVDIDELCK